MYLVPEVISTGYIRKPLIGQGKPGLSIGVNFGNDLFFHNRFLSVTPSL